LDAVANVAAIYPMMPTLEVTEAHWDAVHDLDLRGVFFCSHEALRRMIGQGHGGHCQRFIGVCLQGFSALYSCL
jgi:3-oxoacyl-[acyl-carrier protein] reductase